MNRPALLRLASAVGAAALLASVLWLAGPKLIGELLVNSDLRCLGIAALLALAVASVRALRLVVLVDGLGWFRAIAIATSAQAAASFVPARLGELALPMLLKRELGQPLAAGTAVLLAARGMDLAALGLWAAVGWVGAGLGQILPALLLGLLGLIPLLALVPLLRWSVGVLGDRWPQLSGRLESLAKATAEVLASPLKVMLAAACSVLAWGLVWWMTWWLLAAMGLRWPAMQVVAGSATASVANLLPLNLIANFGTLEAGWTAAFVAFDIPVEVAAASGLGAHVLGLLLTGLLGLGGWAAMIVAGRRREI